MDQVKSEGYPAAEVHELVDVTDNNTARKFGNAFDQQNMYRLGKKQVLRRQFQYFSITGYAMLLGASWETATM